MEKIIKIKKGLDILLMGEAKKQTSNLRSAIYAVKPTDFIGVFPKLLIKEGDQINAGDQLFFNKYHKDIRFTSPVSGSVSEIVRGAKRKILEIRIKADKEDSFIDFGKANPNDLSREEIIEKMLNSGIWPVIRQRPYNVIANPSDVPKSIFVSCFSSVPLAPDFNYIVEKESSTFQTGIDALQKLTDGKIYLNVDGLKDVSPVFSNAKNVEITKFTGKHPVGNVGTQINQISPINKGEVVWTLSPEEIIIIGRLFSEGHYDVSKIIAVAGSETEKPQYFNVKQGISINDLVKVTGQKTEDTRFISGDVFTGTNVGKDGFLGAYDQMVTIIPEGDKYRFMGWLAPGFDRYSFGRTFFSWLCRKKKYDIDTNLNGGRRSFVFSGEFEKVFPFDIYPTLLIKAILAKDIDKMEQLGIYEVIEEDFALCEFIDVSKTDIQKIVREGLDFLREEMN